MPKYPKNKKGKQPLRTRRGPDGRWIPPLPDPEPPDKHNDQGASVRAHETPVTAGGLVIREPSPRPPPLRRTESPQAGDIIVRPVSDSGRETAQRRRSPSANADTARSLPKRPTQQPVTMEGVTDEEAGPRRRTPPLSRHLHHELRKRVSPESKQGDSVLGNPAAESTARDARREETQFHSFRSLTPPENASRFSRNTQSLQRVMREHAERAEVRAQSAYEQNRAALDLISQSLDNVRGAFTEAKRARDRFNDMLSVSSRSRENARRRANAGSPSVYQAEREAADGLRKVADYQRRVRSQVLGSDERRDLQPSTVSSWRLRSGMYLASLSRLVEGKNASMDLGTNLSTVRNTPSEVSRDLDAHRMGVREWVSHQRQLRPQPPTRERSDSVSRRSASPVARVDEVLARYNPVNTPTPAPKRTAGERVSWLDRLNRPSTSRPFDRDTPPHQRPPTTHRMATGAPGGSPSDSSSSPTPSIRNAPPPRTPQTSRRQEGQNPPSRDRPRVPEYLRAHRSPTFEPVAPGGNMTPAQTPNRQRAATPAPAPLPQFNVQNTRRGRPESVDPPTGVHNRLGRRIGTDKIVNMLSVAFIDEDQAAGRVNTVPLHKLGIKSTLPKAYEGQPDQTTFESWLSLLLGFFRIHQLDVLNEVQDRARLEILGQALKEGAHLYFQERHQKIQEQGEVWDFREAILDLRDRYLYKNTPFIAARKFETITQGSRDAQALYDDLTTQAARMIEHPSDYHFRLRFMLALRPEVLEYIIKTHSVSAEQSTLAQIRSACEDFERSNEYGKQLAATKARLGGSRSSAPQNTSRNRPPVRSHTKGPSIPQHTRSNLHAIKPQSAMARPIGEGSSKIPPTRTTLKSDSKAKSANRQGQKTEVKKVSCFNCGGDHYARDCPPENRKAARGYAVRIAEDDAPAPVDDVDSEYHSAGSDPDRGNTRSPEPDSPGSDGEHSDHPEGEQYDPDEDNGYHFSSDDSEPMYSRATRIIATSALNKIESRAARAAKPTLPKVPTVESNRARYKIVAGPQPQRDNRLQRCIEVTVPINGLPARVLLDGGSNTNMLSPEFATVARVSAVELQEQMTLQLAVTGSRSKINYGTWVPVDFGPIKATTYFDIANIDGYDAILGTPFLWEHGVSPIYTDDGWVMKNGKRIHFPSQPSSTSKSSQSFRN